MRALQQQTKSKVGLIAYDVIAKGTNAVRARIGSQRSEGVRLAIADAISDADLYVLGEACADHKLITGGSGIALGLPVNFRTASLLPETGPASDLPVIAGKSVVLSGSASKATNEQVAQWRATRPSFRVEPLALWRGEPVVAQAVEFATKHQDEPVLIYATSTPEEVKAVQKELGGGKAGHLVEQALASIARELRNTGVRKFVIAGGETSGAVVQALDVKSLRIGAQIDPGVPATQSIGEDPVALALKSGNFGAKDFFVRALKALNGFSGHDDR